MRLSRGGRFFFAEHQTADGLIHKIRNDAVDGRLGQVERDDGRQQQLHHLAHRRTHKQRCEHQVAHTHHGRHGQRARGKAQQRGLARTMRPVQIACQKHKRARGQKMHDDADGAAGRADRYALDHAYHGCERQPRGRSEQKGSDENGDVRGVIFKERRGRYQREMDERHQDDGQRGQHGQRGELAGIGGNIAHG